MQIQKQRYEIDELTPFQRELLRVLAESGPLLRSELVLLTGKPRTTIYDNLMRLINLGLVKKVQWPRGRGRPRVLFCLCDYSDRDIKF